LNADYSAGKGPFPDGGLGNGHHGFEKHSPTGLKSALIGYTYAPVFGAKMPIYEYRCSACGHQFEILQKISDQPLTECPSCGKSTLAKLVSAAGFQLKGSGWYVTDFRDGNKKKKDAETGKASKTESENKQTGTGEGANSGSKDTKSNDTPKSD
jgi:putative FmdB family regulatory protein